ncbi:MAG: NUDIX domain-containing protein [Anaerolineae bacterium]|nr:NUDIX domain-containing protein [Anaerolineae bacterium]MDW8097867.1 NUDIX domain-containing protein [Anaerolineae bacterium]
MDTFKETRTYHAAGGVVVHEGNVLLLNRPSRGEVRLPKGHVEPGENTAETALREVREETGYARLRIVGDLGMQQVEFDNPYDGRHYVRHEHYFLMCLDGLEQVTRPAEDAQFALYWVPIAEAADLLTFESERVIMRRAQIAFESGKFSCTY